MNASGEKTQTSWDGQQHFAQYGNCMVALVYCCSCENYALITDGLKLCCDEPVMLEPKFLKKMGETEQKRRYPKKKERDYVLAVQGGECLYCEKPFGLVVYKRSKPTKLALRWDHLVPYVYAQDNGMHNFVAACQICNQFKASKIFKTVEDARVFILSRWKKHGIEEERGDENEAT